MLPGPRADIHDIVRRPHGILVVLHHQHRVAQVPQMDQGVQQLVIIPLVEADAGLIQDIRHAHQTRADLGGQPYPLGLAAG